MGFDHSLLNQNQSSALLGQLHDTLTTHPWKQLLAEPQLFPLIKEALRHSHVIWGRHLHASTLHFEESKQTNFRGSPQVVMRLGVANPHTI